MTDRQRLMLLLALGIAIIAIVALATGLSSVELRAGQPFPIDALMPPRILRQDLLETVGLRKVPNLGPLSLLLVWFILPMTVLYAFLSKHGRRQLLRMLPMLLTAAALLFALSRIREPEKSPLPQDNEFQPPGGLLSQTALPDPPPFIADPPSWFFWLINTLLVFIIVLVIWLLWRRFRPKPEESVQDQLVMQVERTLSDLQSGADFKNAVLRCYAEMTEVLSETHRLNRRQGMTPREFEQYLAKSGFHSDHIRQLTRLFESVRYGDKTPTSREENEAIACLSAISKTYGEIS